MAPHIPRPLLIFTVPTIVLLLGFLWYKKKRGGVESDPGGSRKSAQTLKNATSLEKFKELESKDSLKIEPKLFSRSLSGIESAPIDIIVPPSLRSSKTAPVVISDSELDLEIEKIKSMRSNSTGAVGGRPRSSIGKQSPVTPSKISKFALERSPEQRCSVRSPANTPDISSVCSGNEKVDKEEVVEVVAANMAQSEIEIVNNEENICSSSEVESVKERVVECTSLQNFVNVESEEVQRQSSERDSANHSPADVMLASPSLSCISDNHSEGSSDSGKGCSEFATPPPSQTPGGEGSVSGDSTNPSIYEFVIPQHLVGKLIGRHGAFVHHIKEKTHANILIKKHPESTKLKICAVEGTQAEIEAALQVIRDKFPEKRYPDITLEQVTFLTNPALVSLVPEYVHLNLIEGISNDTIVCCMVAPNHLFLQQPTHPTFPSLNILTGCMNICYSDVNSPLLPTPIKENTVCAACSLGAWYRAMTVSTDSERGVTCVKFLDYGGYETIDNSMLRQIRWDFLTLPFQASECLLYNIKPSGGADAIWAQEAFDLVASLTKGTVVFTEIAEYTEDGIPLVYVCVATNQGMVYINEELVRSGYAEWVQVDEVPAEA